MKKSDIRFHGEHGRQYPALDVKARRLPWGNETVAEHFKCDAATAARAGEFSYGAAQEQFWRGVQEIAAEVFGSTVAVYSGGRSGGWLEVRNLPDVETWDAVAAARWCRFEKMVRREIAYLSAWEYHKEAIEANQWALPGAEEYNFIDTKDGKTRCIAELKREAIAAGFGAVVRP